MCIDEVRLLIWSSGEELVLGVYSAVDTDNILFFYEFTTTNS